MPMHLNLKKTFAGHQTDISAVAFSSDEKLLASAGGDRRIRVWSVESQQQVLNLEHGEWVNAVAFAPGSRFIASGGRDGNVKLWSIEKGQLVGSIQSHPNNATSVAFSKDGSRIISGGQEGRIRIFNLREKKLDGDVAAHQGWIWRVALSYLGDRLLSAGGDSVAKIWRLDGSQQPLVLAARDTEVLYASFSPDDARVATAGKDGAVTVWESASGRQLYSFAAHEGAVNSVNFSPDGGYLLTAGADKLLKTWDASNGQLSAETRGGFDYISECVFSPSGQALASCGGDGMVKLWVVSDRPSTVAVVEDLVHDPVAAERAPDMEVAPDPLLDTGPRFKHSQQDAEQSEIKRDPLLDTGPLVIPKGGTTGKRVHVLLSRAIGEAASDIHIPSGSPVVVRLHGSLKPLEGETYSPADTEGMLMEVLTPDQRRIFQDSGDLDFSYEIPAVGRFRANICRQHRGVDGTFRIIPENIPTPEQLGLPPSVPSFTKHHQGLVLITGPAGQGKSTTIAALIDLINGDKPLHVITVEDPIEYVYPIKKAVINQREVGKHTLSFANALRAALREDPDVIVVGEMRDLETMSLAITAAETGHLVFGSLMTTDAAQTVDRILDSFPPGQQAQIRTMLSESLRGIISQQLIPNAEGTGRVLATEVLICTLAVGNMIRERKTHQLNSVMQTGRNIGMQRMDDALLDLCQTGSIAVKEALLYAHDPAGMEIRARQLASGAAGARAPAPTQARR